MLNFMTVTCRNGLMCAKKQPGTEDDGEHFFET